MTWEKELLKNLHASLSPSDFEMLVYTLLEQMGFSDLELLGRSGDRGIDLKATWTQSQVPGLEIDLSFVIQVKRFSPSTSLNPSILRELRGTMQSGEWGLLITTGRVSKNTREDGLRDQSRIISVIDGSQLASLCAEYEVGVKKEYLFDDAFLRPKVEVEEEAPEVSAPPSVVPRDLGNILTNVVGETFEKIGRAPLYRSPNKLVIGRRSQKYKRTGQDYWYGLKARDFELIKNYNVTHFAYVCANDGVVLLPKRFVLNQIEADKLLKSPKEGPLIHYHIVFREEEEGLMWVLKTGITENVEQYYHRV